MGISVHVEVDEVSYTLDPIAMAEVVAEGMKTFYAGQLAAGLQPDGSALPKNKQGLPLGRGDGSIVRGWTARTMTSTEQLGRAATEPGQSGRLAIAVRQLRRRGVLFQSVTGAADQALSRMISDEVTRQHEAANHGGATGGG